MDRSAPSGTLGLTHLVEAFDALSHRDRLRILSHLARRFEEGDAPESGYVQDDPRACTFGTLRGQVHLRQSSLSYHVQILADAGLIDRVRRGRYTYLRLRRDRIGSLSRFLDQLGVVGWESGREESGESVPAGGGSVPARSTG